MIQRRRRKFNFREMKIANGSVLRSTDTGEEVIVKTERTVIFRDAEMYLTEATVNILGGYQNPCEHWEYNGKRLIELYNQTY